MKMIEGKIVFEALHFERVFSSLKTLQFDTPVSFSKEYLLQNIQELVERNKHQALARIRLTVFRGYGYLNDDNNTPNYIIQSWSLPYPFYNEKGLSVGLYKEAKKSCDVFSNIKSNNYLPSAMAAIWCKKQSFDDAFILNSNHNIAEATTSNIFIIKDGIIRTPALSEGCVAGVTRQYLLQCFEREGITCEQTSLTEEDILGTDETFLTNTGFYIQWVERYNTRLYSNTMSKILYERFILPLLKFSKG